MKIWVRWIHGVVALRDAWQTQCRGTSPSVRALRRVAFVGSVEPHFFDPHQSTFMDPANVNSIA